DGGDEDVLDFEFAEPENVGYFLADLDGDGNIDGLVINLDTEDDTMSNLVIIRNYFDNTQNLSWYQDGDNAEALAGTLGDGALETIQFSDESSYDADDIVTMATTAISMLAGTAGADTLNVLENDEVSYLAGDMGDDIYYLENYQS